jgi:hypothetical protein
MEKQMSRISKHYNTELRALNAYYDLLTILNDQQEGYEYVQSHMGMDQVVVRQGQDFHSQRVLVNDGPTERTEARDTQVSQAS